MEREISFRTESGLYYSYYKQLVNTPSFAQGNAAVHTVNIYQIFVPENFCNYMVTMKILFTTCVVN